MNHPCYPVNSALKVKLQDVSVLYKNSAALNLYLPTFGSHLNTLSARFTVLTQFIKEGNVLLLAHMNMRQRSIFICFFVACGQVLRLPESCQDVCQVLHWKKH